MKIRKDDSPLDIIIYLFADTIGKWKDPREPQSNWIKRCICFFVVWILFEFLCWASENFFSSYFDLVELIDGQENIVENLIKKDNAFLFYTIMFFRWFLSLGLVGGFVGCFYKVINTKNTKNKKVIKGRNNKRK